MLRRDSSAFLVLGLFALLAVACQPKIGDSCTTSTDCSATGDRLCDITEPGGYCTVFNCEPGSCPSESACVNFGTEISPVVGCATGDGTSPYQRAFCMFRCSSDSDCRSGYACTAIVPGNRFGAEVAEYSGGNQVCMVRDSTTEPMLTQYDGGTNQGVCLGSDAGPSASFPSGGGASAGGMGGSGGEAAGAGGSDAGAGG